MKKATAASRGQRPRFATPEARRTQAYEAAGVFPAVLKPTRRDIRTARYSCPIADSTTAYWRAILVSCSSPLEPIVVRADKLRAMVRLLT